MEWKEIEPQVHKLNEGLLELMDGVKALSEKDARYPVTNEMFDTSLHHLHNPSYDIVVCGEVKKGKSSLLNAIVGQNVLPVDVNVATSQVFRISHSDEEAFSLEFTDGTQRRITREQLASFGSQVNVNRDGEMDLEDKVLSHIQVEIPAQFLPEHVNLVDTPGLGAVYKSHEWLTQNYIRNAAAVLFVFEASQPMMDIEKAFINKVLDITPHVMFVMTKIDLVAASEWTLQQQRLEDSLAEIFKARNLPSPKVFPISSKALMDAATEDEEDFKLENIRTSMFPILKDELMSMIVRAVALGRSSVGMYEAQGQVLKLHGSISDLLKVAAEEGKCLDQQLRSGKQTKQQELQEEWGNNSKKTKDTLSAIGNICNIVNNRVDQMFRMSSTIRQQYISRIDAINSMTEIRSMCNDLPSAVSHDVAQQWESIMRDAVNETSAILQTAVSHIDRTTLDADCDLASVDMLEVTSAQRLNTIRTVIGTGSMGVLIGSIVFPPIAIIVGIGAAVWAWLAGTQNEIQRNKSNLKQKLNELMDKLCGGLKDARDGNRLSVVGEFVNNLRQNAEETLQKAVDAKREEIQNQLKNLEEQAKKGMAEKREECMTLQTDLRQCNELVAKTKRLGTLKKQIEDELQQ